MATARQRLAAFREHHDACAPTVEARLSLTDAEAIDLVAELAPSDVRHPIIIGAAGALALHLAEPMPVLADNIVEWAAERSRLVAALWGGLSGESIDGVTILRRPS